MRIGCGIYWVWIALVDMLKRHWSINYTLINLGKVAWNVQAKERIRIDCVCVAFCMCGFVCKRLYVPALYSWLGFSVSVTTSVSWLLLCICHNFHFSFSWVVWWPYCILIHHDRTLMAWPLIWYYLIAWYMFIWVVTGQSTLVYIYFIMIKLWWLDR